jgi:hypothetical protein
MAKILTIADSLKGLYAKLGGTPADVEDTSTVTEMIQEITEVAGSGGSGGGLPEITSADNGKVLTVGNKTTGEVFIPKQSITNSGAPVPLAKVTIDASTLEEGTIATVNMSGINSVFTYQYVQEGNSNAFVKEDGNAMILFFQNQWVFFSEMYEGTFEIEASIGVPTGEYEPQWKSLPTIPKIKVLNAVYQGSTYIAVQNETASSIMSYINNGYVLFIKITGLINNADLVSFGGFSISYVQSSGNYVVETGATIDGEKITWEVQEDGRIVGKTSGTN